MHFRQRHIKWFSFLIGFFVGFTTFAQESAIIPLSFNQYPVYNSLRNPSTLHRFSEGKYNINGGYLGYTGVRKANNLSFLAYSKKIKSLDTNRKSYVGIHVMNESIGKFFRTVRFYLDYKLKMPLNNELDLAAGVSMGMYNFNVYGNSYTSGLSSFAIDGNIGFSLVHSKFQSGVSLVQFLNSSVKTNNDFSVLKRHYHFFGEYYFRPSSVVTGTLFSTYLLDIGELDEVNVGANAFYKELIGIQTVMSYPDGIDFSMLFKKLKLYNGFIDFGLRYNLLSTSVIVPGSNHFELSLNYYN